MRRKEGNVLFNDALNTFYLRLYGVTKDEKGTPLPPVHGFGINHNILNPHMMLCVEHVDM